MDAAESRGPEASPRAMALATELRGASAALIELVGRIAPERWSRIRKPGEWAPGKDAEHVADAVAMHIWHVHAALGVPHAAKRPVIERARLTSVRSQVEVVALLRTRVADAALLIEGLTEAQLELRAKPPRTVADIIARPLIGHLRTHQRDIESKLRAS